MIIGIDASKLGATKKTGVEISTSELIKAVLTQDKENTYWLYSKKPLPSSYLTNDRIKNIIVPGKRFWTLIALSKELKQRPPDIFWAPSNFLPYNLPRRSVATIHDLAFYLFPESYTLKNRLLSTFTLKRAIKQAATLIAVSKQTKKDLKNYFSIPGENIEVIYHSLRTDLKLNQIDFKTVYPNLNKYFICIGRLESRKNLLNIIYAFNQFNQSDNNSDIKLFLGGSKGYGYKKIINLIKKLKLEDKIIIAGYINLKHLNILYKNSLALICPSLYEGFGLNILEGFTANTPVMTSNLGAMREISGGAALLVDPFDITSIANGLKKLAYNKNLRQELVLKGKDRLADFSWEESADKLINLWSKISK